MENFILDIETFCVLLRGNGFSKLSTDVTEFHEKRLELIPQLEHAIRDLSPNVIQTLFSEQIRKGGQLKVMENATLAFVFPQKKKATDVSLDTLRQQASELGLDISHLGRKKKEIQALLTEELKKRNPFQEEINASIPKVY